MYHVDLQGNMVFEKLNLNEERIDLIQNPLLGPLLRRREQLLKNDRMTRRANKLAIYYFNVHKRYDLDVSPTHLLIYFSELPIVQADNTNGPSPLRLLPVHVPYRIS